MPTGIYLHKKGWKHTKKTRIKMSEAQIGEKNHNWGKKVSRETKKKMSELKTDEKHPNWKGDDVRYRALHTWVNNKLGKPDTCQNCGRDNLVGHQIHWANISGEYKRDLTDWLRLCPKCHGAFKRDLVTI